MSDDELDAPPRRRWLLLLGLAVGVLAVLSLIGYFAFTWTLSTVLATPPCSVQAKDLASRLGTTSVLAQPPGGAAQVSRYVRCGDGAGDSPGTAVFTGATFQTAVSRSRLVAELEKSSALGTWRRGLHGNLDGTTPQDVKNVAFVETTYAGRGICVSLFQDAPQDFRVELSASTVADVSCPGPN